MSPTASPDPTSGQLRYIPLSYNTADSHASALRLVLSLFPHWEQEEGQIELIRFKDGITNTLLKVVKRKPGYTEDQIDNDAVLLRAYGRGTEALIDRDREATSHSLLSKSNLAPPLLARFQNGLLYRFIQGHPCQPRDLSNDAISRGIARRLAQWHAILPISTENQTAAAVHDLASPLSLPRSGSSAQDRKTVATVNAITNEKATPNIWAVMQKWILALPSGTEAEAARNTTLQKELERIVKDLGDRPGLGKDGLVFGHCDLLSGNVIVHPHETGKSSSDDVKTVSFIDYEYATPVPAAFDLANHLSEWTGFECDYNILPTRSQRRLFLKEYLASYNSYIGGGYPTDDDLQTLFDEVDLFRGIPGFYWCIWALIQATISQIDFDYASYAEIRLAEYWAWRDEATGVREKEGKPIPLRERRWATEA